MSIVGYDNKKAFDIELEDILYFEAFGDDLFCFTMMGRYQVRLKLYDTEEYSQYGFIRVNKSMVVNVFKIIALTPQVNSRIKLRMKNQHVLYINRSYIKNFKEYLKKGEYKND
jgi:DNA-binding LytR/AlgR family response regulator